MSRAAGSPCVIVQRMGLYVANPLHGCYAKLARAERHLAELESLIATWRQVGELDEVRGVYDEARGTWTLLAPDPGPPPIEIGAVVGDLLHNLRTCLDQLVAGLVRSDGGKRGMNTKFPFARTEADWTRATRPPKGALTGISAHHLAVLHRHQPIDDPKGVLAGLQVMSNAEKHALFLPTLLAVTRVVVTNGAEFPHSFLMRDGDLLTPGSPMIEFEVPIDRLDLVAVAVGTQVAFAQAEGTLEPVGRLADLRIFVALVRNLLAEFAVTGELPRSDPSR